MAPGALEYALQQWCIKKQYTFTPTQYNGYVQFDVEENRSAIVSVTGMNREAAASECIKKLVSKGYAASGEIANV